MNSAPCATGYTGAYGTKDCMGCASGYKNDGQSKCVANDAACAPAYISDGTGSNCKACNVPDYKSNGNQQCVSK